MVREYVMRHEGLRVVYVKKRTFTAVIVPPFQLYKGAKLPAEKDREYVIPVEFLE